jgi:hypothetical protein
MKKVLSLLMAFVFLQVQSWALSGGPFDNPFTNNITGTYAGVMIGSVPAGGAGVLGGAGLGIFTIGLPTGGIGTGIFALYSGGASIGGDIIGLGDPKLQTIKGVMTGTFIPNVAITGGTVFGGVVTQIGAQFDATIEQASTKSLNALSSGTRINGTAGATITYYEFPTRQVSTDFVLVGYKQSSDPNAATAITLPDSFSGSGG